MNQMKEIGLEKVTVNIGAGTSQPDLEKGQMMIKSITGTNVVITRTKKRSTFGVPKHRAIGAKATLRGEKAMEFLKKVLNAVDNRISPKQFDSQGNFSFGIKEYIHIPGVKYDPDIGILGMDVAVTLYRPGYRVARRKLRPAKIGKNHRIKPEESMKWAEEKLGVKIAEKEERRYW